MKTTQLKPKTNPRNIYIFEGPGLAMGSLIIVAANTYKQAQRIADTEQAKYGLIAAELRESFPVKLLADNPIIHSWNGDY